MFSRPVIIAVLMTSIALPAATKQRHKAKPTTQPPVAAQPAPVQPPQQQAPPPPPPTPEQGPSSPPEVSFKGGQLTILARNSTMSDVLNQVKQKTGAAIEMPPASSERVVGQFGPGAPRDVIAQLLNGSHYDYVLMGSPTDPGSLKKVVLMARASGPEPIPQPNPQQNPNLQAVPDVEQEQTTEDATPDVPADVPAQADQDEPQGQQPPQGMPGAPNGGPVVKTPEQMLRELQQQQQQQQQQGQPPQ